MITGTIIPIACGRHSENVELPVLFALHFGIILQAALLSAFIEYHEQVYKELTRRGQTFGGLFSDLWSTIIGEPTYDDLARIQVLEAAAKMNELEKLVEPAQTLTAYFQELLTF
jgi:hypothetical protein